MQVLKTVMWASMSFAVLGVLGCDVFLGGRSRQDPAYLVQQPTYAQQPQYVEQQPQYVDQQPQYIVVQQAPPPVIVERRPPQPVGGSIWVDGYWNWSNQRYGWQAGRYVVPPQPDVVWVAPRYEKDPHGYRFTPGQWKKQNAGNGRDPGNGRDAGDGQGRGRGGN